MLTQLPEWYRIAELSPSDETLDKRRSAIREIIDAFATGDAELLTSAVCAASAGFDGGFDESSPLVQVATAAVKKYQPAFPCHIRDNALHLRACVCIALGDILDGASRGSPNEMSVAIAALLIPSLGSRPPLRQRHLQAALNELYRLAMDVSDKAGASKRTLPCAATVLFPEIEQGGDDLPQLAEFCREIADSTKACFDAAAATIRALQMKVDVVSEELNLLWWLTSGCVSASREPLAAVSSGIATLRAAQDLAKTAIVPILESVRNLARRAVSEKRKSAELGKTSLRDLVATWNVQEAAAFSGASGRCNMLITTYPPVLPISWICMRIAESGATTGWSDEFTRKTGIGANYERTIPDWAVQLVNELVAKRLLMMLIGE